LPDGQLLTMEHAVDDLMQATATPEASPVEVLVPDVDDAPHEKQD
jgi:hypothetical protein